MKRDRTNSGLFWGLFWIQVLRSGWSLVFVWISQTLYPWILKDEDGNLSQSKLSLVCALVLLFAVVCQYCSVMTTKLNLQKLLQFLQHQ